MPEALADQLVTHPHPLAPLDPGEIRVAAGAALAAAGDGARILGAALAEPDKEGYLGCDCLGEIAYLDAHLADDSGGVRTIANAICVHEEDAGILWKHTDDRTGGVETRRGRRLVVNAMTTVGNHEYAFRWYFGLDGTIEVEIQLHGIVSTMVPGASPPLGSNVVDAGLVAPHHQHLFCFRLDVDVDGTANRVREVESEPVPAGPDNPVGNAFRRARPSCARSWRPVAMPTMAARAAGSCAFRALGGLADHADDEGRLRAAAGGLLRGTPRRAAQPSRDAAALSIPDPCQSGLRRRR